MRAGRTRPEERQRDAGAELGLRGGRVSEGRAGLGAEGPRAEDGGPRAEDGAEAEGSGCPSSAPGHGAGPVIPLPSIPALSLPPPPPLSPAFSRSVEMCGCFRASSTTFSYSPGPADLVLRRPRWARAVSRPGSVPSPSLALAFLGVRPSVWSSKLFVIFPVFLLEASGDPNSDPGAAALKCCSPRVYICSFLTFKVLSLSR